MAAIGLQHTNVAWEDISIADKKKFAESLGETGIRQSIKRFTELATTGKTEIPCAACVNATEKAISLGTCYYYNCHVCAYPRHEEINEYGRCCNFLRISKRKMVGYPPEGSLVLLTKRGYITNVYTGKNKKLAIDWCLAVAKDYEALLELL